MIVNMLPFLLSFYLKYHYRKIGYLFVLLVSIGVTQGICEHVAMITGSDGVQWGAIKVLVILGMFCSTIANVHNMKRMLANRLLIWTSLFVLLCLAIAWHVVSAVSAGNAINVFNVLQNFSLLNMLMVYVAYFAYRSEYANSIVDMLVFLGRLTSYVAVAQWLLFKYFENNVVVMEIAKNFGRLNADDGEKIRIFSVFQNSYGLSAFLMLVTVLYFNKLLAEKRNINNLTLYLFVSAHALTYNLTGMGLTFLGCLFAYVMQMSSGVLAVKYAGKVAIRLAAAIFVVSLLLFSFGEFRQRITGIFDYSETSSGAGNSLYLRNKFIHTGLDTLAENITGIGLTLTDTSKPGYEDQGYVRSGIIDDFSADAYFLWLFVQVGLFWGVLLVAIYIYPFVSGVRVGKIAVGAEKWQCCAVASLLFVVLAGSMSNSMILTYPPANILIWCAVGAVFAMPTKQSGTVC